MTQNSSQYLHKKQHQISKRSFVNCLVAWYAANTQVIGQGMHINCSTSKNLVITNNDESSWAATASAVTTNTTTLNPISTADFDDYSKYFKVTDKSYVDYATGRLKNGAETAAALTAAINEGDNTSTGVGVVVRRDRFKVKLDAVATDTITLRIASISLTRGNDSSLISKAVRMGIKTSYSGTGTATPIDQIYAPFGNTANVTYDALAAAGTVANQDGNLSITAYADASSNALTSEVTALYTKPADNTTLVTNFCGQDVLTFDFYWWLEGCDDNCTSANSVALDDITVSVTFDYPAA